MTICTYNGTQKSTRNSSCSQWTISQLGTVHHRTGHCLCISCWGRTLVNRAWHSMTIELRKEEKIKSGQKLLLMDCKIHCHTNQNKLYQDCKAQQDYILTFTRHNGTIASIVNIDFNILPFQERPGKKATNKKVFTFREAPGTEDLQQMFPPCYHNMKMSNSFHNMNPRTFNVTELKLY